MARRLINLRGPWSKEFRFRLILSPRRVSFAIDRRGQKTETSPRNGPRNAGNASNFTPGHSRPDSMFDCARGLRSNYTRFSRVRSTKESWPFRHRWPFVIRFRPERYREILLIDRERSYANIFSARASAEISLNLSLPGNEPASFFGELLDDGARCN